MFLSWFWLYGYVYVFPVISLFNIACQMKGKITDVCGNLL
jgi:hypothetical protein